jgi:hypothetical protein
VTDKSDDWFLEVDVWWQWSMVNVDIGVYICSVGNQDHFTTTHAPSISYRRIGCHNETSRGCHVALSSVEVLGIQAEQGSASNKVVLSPVDTDFLLAATEY